jgi:GNAT superfamily N-acetyltransferase
MKVFSDISMKNKITLGGGWFDKKVEQKKIDPDIYKKRNIKFLDYQYFSDDDEEWEMMDEEREILDYFVEEGNGLPFCQGKISPEYIQNAFEEKGIIGKIMTVGKEGLYVGFILFQEKSNFSLKKGGYEAPRLYLNLLCAVSTKDFPQKKGIPVGALLIKEMEKYAYEKDIREIYANAVPDALSFYKKNGYKTVEKKFIRKLNKFFKREKDEIPIVKKIKIKKKLGFANILGKGKIKKKGGHKKCKKCSKILKSGNRKGKKCNRLNCKYHK